MQRIADSKVKPKSAGSRKFFAGGGLIVLAIIALIANGIQTGGNYYLTLDELAAKGPTIVGQGVRVNAVVDKESVNYDSRAISLAFDLVDPEDGTRRAVLFNDPMPDLFLKSESVIVEGVVNDSGTLEAHTILVKCPSKYEEAQQNGAMVPADHLEGLVHARAHEREVAGGKVASGKRQVASGKWQVASGKWQVASLRSKSQVASLR